jgi:hypothetical protein
MKSEQAVLPNTCLEEEEEEEEEEEGKIFERELKTNTKSKISVTCTDRYMN